MDYFSAFKQFKHDYNGFLCCSKCFHYLCAVRGFFPPCVYTVYIKSHFICIHNVSNELVAINKNLIVYILSSSWSPVDLYFCFCKFLHYYNVLCFTFVSTFCRL